MYGSTLALVVASAYAIAKLLGLNPEAELLIPVLCALMAFALTLALKVGRVEGKVEGALEGRGRLAPMKPQVDAMPS